MDDPAALEVIRLLGLEPHPEGGHFVETWRQPTVAGERPAGTAIYYLLQADERSHWHRIDATEVWHHYAGAPVALATAPEGGEATTRVLGTDLAAGQRPQLVVAPEEWQSATPIDGWALVGCTVSPGFRFDAFELAPTGWRPPGSVGPDGR